MQRRETHQPRGKFLNLGGLQLNNVIEDEEHAFGNYLHHLFKAHQ